jgi:hypothetical protein
VHRQSTQLSNASRNPTKFLRNYPIQSRYLGRKWSWRMSMAWIWRVITWALLALIGAFPCFAIEPGKRIALVIGNSAYKHTGALANPANDAEDMANALTTLGFDVTKGVDLDIAGMDRAVRSFAEKLKGAKLGLFYYAGHGLQVAGHNHLLPIDAKIESVSALEFETMRLESIQRIMENETETNVLFLDACRDNPLAKNLARSMGTRSSAVGRGLAPQESGAGTLISFSTQPGNVALDGTGGRNSPYAGALVKHIATPGEDLPTTLVKVRNDVRQATNKLQVPWEHSALTAQVILARASQDDKPMVKPDKTGSSEAALSSESGDSSVSKTKSGECSEESPIKPFTPLFQKVRQAYNANFIDSTESSTRKQKLIERMLPMIERMQPSAPCALIYLGEVKFWYDKDYIDLAEYKSIKSVLTKKFFAE